MTDVNAANGAVSQRKIRGLTLRSQRRGLRGLGLLDGEAALAAGHDGNALVLSGVQHLLQGCAAALVKEQHSVKIRKCFANRGKIIQRQGTWGSMARPACLAASAAMRL